MDRDQLTLVFAVVGGVASIVGTAWVLYQFYERISGKRTRLKGVLIFGEFLLPPIFANHASSHTLVRWDYVRCFWILKISNKSTSRLDGVVLYIPRTQLVQISEDGDDNIKLVSPTDNTPLLKLELGSFSPSHSVEISGWSWQYPENTIVKKFRLAHHEGIGTISAFYLVGAPWSWIAKHTHVIYPILFGIIIGFIIELIGLINR